MQKLYFAFLFISLFTSSCITQKASINQNDVSRIIKTLSSDKMEGRGLFSPGIDKAADFIAAEFKAIGLSPFGGTTDFRQVFEMTTLSPVSCIAYVNDKVVDPKDVFVITGKQSLNWQKNSGVEIQYIKAGESFTVRYKAILQLHKPVFVYVDPSFFDAFKRFREYYSAERIIDKVSEDEAVFVLGNETDVQSFTVNFGNKIEKQSFTNIIGELPGKSKELVVFSGHYDHLGIIDAVEGDSIANGADDDASGITAVISLAKHYKKLNNNERTLVFAAFTAEEIGGKGSQYFSKQLNPEDVVAMFNIEMIGKESKFGKNSAFITGFDKSDFGTILQRNLNGTEFKFHPDPYPAEQLFYRSDNATLAALGVPAHTISTDQIDIDKYYHTVNDELSTLDIANITATIKAIALSSRSIVDGRDTPKRIPPVSER